MKFYTLNDNIYLVYGAARACLYDLTTLDLFSISHDVARLIEATAEFSFEALTKTEKDKTILEGLIACQLLKKTDQLQPLKDIKELAVNIPQNFSWIEVTRRCNLSCNFCYEGSNPYCIEKMSLDEFELVADQLRESGVTKIQFIGGEPMILKDELKQMIRYARPLFHAIEVYTNGVMINEKWCEFFKQYDINIAISIHSYIESEHDKITQVTGSHRRVTKAQELLLKHNIRHRIGTVRTKDCQIGKPEENTAYRLTPKLPKASGLADLQAFDLDMFKQKAITKKTKSRLLSKEQIIRGLSGHQCFDKGLYISATLDVYPCVMERRISYGNLKHNNLDQLLKASTIRKMNKDNVEGCKHCEYRYGCFDCRPDSNGNSLLSKPWYCTYDPTKGEWHEVEKVFSNLKGRQKLSAIPVLAE